MAPAEEPTKSGGAVNTGAPFTPSSLDLSASSAEWSIVSKGFFFCVIVAAIVIYLRISAQRAARNSSIREKSLA
jgi:hypothetical protein